MTMSGCENSFVRLRDVLAHERHRQRRRELGTRAPPSALEQRDVRGLEQAVAHAVDLREHVREQRQIQSRARLIILSASSSASRSITRTPRARRPSASGTRACGARRRRAPRRAREATARSTRRAAAPADSRYHSRSSKTTCGCDCTPFVLRRLLDTRRDFLQNLSRFVGASRLLRGGARRSVGRAEHSVEDEKRELPAQPVAGARSCESPAARGGPRASAARNSAGAR